MIPTEVNMDDLLGLEKLQPSMLLNLMFSQSDANIERKTALYRRIYIRLIDKALDEYQESRNLIVAQIKEGKRSIEDMARAGRFIYMLKFVDHMENCITTIRRILRLLENLKGNVQHLTFPRVIRKHIESLTTPLVGMRNMIEHIEQKIQKDCIQEDEPVMLKLSKKQDGVVIAGQHLKFSDLSTLIKGLHELGQKMINWSVEDDDVQSKHT